MKVFIAVHHFPPRYTGGAELRALRTALSLQRLGHTVQVFAVERIDDVTVEGLAWDDDVYENIPVRRIRFNGASTPDWFNYAYENAWIGQHLNQFLSEIKPDLFHLFGGYLLSGDAIHAAANLGIPTVLSLTDYWFLCPSIQLVDSRNRICHDYLNPAVSLQCYEEQKRRYRWLGRIFPKAMKAYWQANTKGILRFRKRQEYLINTLNRVDAIITPSRFIGEMHTRAGVKPEKIIHIRQGRTIPNLTPDLLDKKASNTLRLAYMGQLTEIKGVHILLEAMRLLPQSTVSLDIYGDLEKFPAYVKKLRQIARNDPRIRFRGVFQPSLVSTIFQQLDALVVPSVWYENSPNVILEAFAHRTPVIASNQGALPELVEDGKNGLLFQMGVSKSLAEAIHRLLQDQALLARLTDGIGPVKNEEQEINQLAQVYQHIQNGVKAANKHLDF